MSTPEKELKKNPSTMRSDLEIVNSKLPYPKCNLAMVVLSGGQDSTTALFWALKNFKTVRAVHIQYGQKHALEELASVERIADLAGVSLDTFPLHALQEIGGGGLTNNNIDIMSPHPVYPWLPGSFVPGRNAVLFSLSAAFALSLGYPNLVTGVCQTDYSGYPDCRIRFINSMEIAIEDAIGMDERRTQVALGETNFRIWAPLMYLTKKETVVLANSLPGCYRALAFSTTCYKGEFPPCGECPACKLRAHGFKEANTPDPIFRRNEFLKEIDHENPK